MTGKAASAAIILLLFALWAGCTAPPGNGITPVPTSPPQTIVTTQTPPPTPAIIVPPGPVVTVPPQYDVAIQVTRNPNTAFPYITVTFRGGNGQFILQEIEVTVARSDGMIIQEVVPKTGGDRYSVGDYVSIEGTTGTDRVVVVVTLNGVAYKMYDEDLPFTTTA